MSSPPVSRPATETPAPLTAGYCATAWSWPMSLGNAPHGSPASMRRSSRFSIVGAKLFDVWNVLGIDPICNGWRSASLGLQIYPACASGLSNLRPTAGNQRTPGFASLPRRYGRTGRRRPGRAADGLRAGVDFRPDKADARSGSDVRVAVGAANVLL